MKFCEAMELLKKGSKVTRQPWDGGVYFIMVNEDVKSFQPKLAPYLYNEDIMVSTGWYVEDNEKEYNFCEIIPFLQQGKKAWMFDWSNMYIFYDRTQKYLVLHSMEIQQFIPDFESFVAQDWIEIE